MKALHSRPESASQIVCESLPSLPSIDDCTHQTFRVSNAKKHAEEQPKLRNPAAVATLADSFYFLSPSSSQQTDV